MTYTRINNLTGWGVFLVALVTYLLTVAPTASFWDCGEFIACSNELEVTHPPGAPLFLLLGRIMSMLAFGDVTHIAFMVNLLSVFSGAFTVLLTFWIITMLARKATRDMEIDEKSRTLAIMFAGVIGGLTCTFADSLWFNAVEAEVYAMSSTFTALVVWLMLKWENRADQPDHLRWILLIAYVMGLAIGVHLLNLLAIPALALMYFFRKYEFSIKGLFATLGISIGTLFFIQYGLLQYTFSLAWQFEKLFTGTVTREGAISGGMGMPMGTGTIVMGILVTVIILGLLFWSIKRKNALLNIIVLGIILISIGISSYATIYIRSNANPPIDMNNPENILTYLSYMKREQYGERPLLSGPLYHSQPVMETKGKYRITKTEPVEMRYTLLEGQSRYVEDRMVEKPVYADRDVVWFPRMYYPDRYDAGPHGYTTYVKRTGKKDKNGRDITHTDDRPTRMEDLSFFLGYQINHMYFRYFMWNFTGRSSDIQDDGWETGFNRAQNLRNADNKGKNHYFAIPLLLGFMGLFWHFISDKKGAFVVATLFLFTGIAIIIYLNQYPFQPRERDYSYAGSFQTFCIWVGMGVLFLWELLRKYLHAATPWVAGGLALLAPILMVSQNWDDHTRKGRWIDIEFAKNLLNSCAPNAILFTAGDNDTFSLWYVQEVEDFRDDVQVVNLELLISDWYIYHMSLPHNESPGIPISMKKNDYAGDKEQLIRGNYSRQIALPTGNGLAEKLNLTPDEKARMDSVMVWDYRARSPNFIYRKDSVIVDMVRNIANAGWERPIYFANTMSPSNFMGLQSHFHQEGMAYRILPYQKKITANNRYLDGDVRQEIMYTNLMEKFLFTGLNDPKVYTDQHIRTVIVNNYRNCFFRLSNSYAEDIYTYTEELDTLRIQATLDPTLVARVNLLDQQVAASREKITALMTRLQEQIPDNMYRRTLQMTMRRVQMYYQANILDDLAAAEIDVLRKKIVDRFDYFKATKRTVEQGDPGFNGSLLVISFLAQQGKFDEAKLMAQRLQGATGGNPIGLQFLQQIQNQE